ncbi:MAG: thermopsin family protease [Thermoplasmata archaeon]
MAPLYKSTPAPIGLAEYGLDENATGNVTPFILNTTSVQGTFNPGVDGPNATDLADSSPDGYGVQLNAVTTNVTLLNESGYQFWTQNVLEYFPYTGEFVMVTNVWNFSSPASYLSPNVFYSHGPLGTQVGTEYYYSEDLAPMPIEYPFNVNLTMLSSIIGGRNAVNFSVNVTAPNGSVIWAQPNFDWVIFNSIANNSGVLSPNVTVASYYTANGFSYNPLGLTNDFELTIGGPGGGSQTSFLQSDATETLSYYNETSSTYQAVPSAFSYGGETGETSTGVTESWATNATGAPFGILETGPSLLGGLWNASSPAGGPAEVQFTINPSNAFVLISYNGNSSTAFNITEPELAPTVTTNTMWLPAGNYSITVELSGYDSMTANGTLEGGSVYPISANLVANASTGVYTPLWAWTNAQVGNLSASGLGTQASPYILLNNQTQTFPMPFGQLNDYGFPVWPGVYFIGTTAYTDFNSPPTFVANTSGMHIGASALPTTNALPYWFYGTSNVAITNATNITGWYSSSAIDYPYFLTFNVNFWNSTNMLIYNDTFDTESNALIMYNGYSTTNPNAIGNATVWGNTFTQVQPPSPNGSLVSYAQGLGLSEQENGDLIFNNAFYTPTTAVSYPTDLYYGYLTAYFDSYNISPQNATNSTFIGNWPAFNLTGSIIGTSTQGGNFWWDYGIESQYGFLGGSPNYNPYNAIPYTESGWLDIFSPGVGDYAPLISYALYGINLNETGLFSHALWEYQVTAEADSTTIYYDDFSVASSLSLQLPTGNYTVTAMSSGYTAAAVDFEVVNTSVNVTLVFVATETFHISFEESGLTPVGTTWILQFNGVVRSSATPYINITGIAPGIYHYFATTTAPGWNNPAPGTLDVSSNGTVTLYFTPYAPSYNVYFTVSGVPSGTSWNVTFGNGVGATNYSTTFATLIVTDVAPGTYNWSTFVPGSSNFNTSTPNGTVSVTNAPVSIGITFVLVTYTVTFTQTTLPADTWWAVSLGGVIQGSNTSTIVFNVPAGTYAILIGYISEYTSSFSPSTTPITVSTAMAITVTFA